MQISYSKMHYLHIIPENFDDREVIVCLLR